MLKELDNFYDQLEEPNKSVFLFLRQFIPSLDEKITVNWRYKLPFFDYKGKMFCYLWKDKKTNEPYISIVRSENLKHPKLILGERKKMKAYFINPNKDIDVEELRAILVQAMGNY